MSLANGGYGFFPRTRAAVPRRCGGGRGRVPPGQAAADARLSGGGRDHRSERDGAGPRLGERAVPGRVRRGLPDVRDRARVQPAQAQEHAQAGLRARLEPGVADHARGAARQHAARLDFRAARAVLGPALAKRNRTRRCARDEQHRHRRQADGRTPRTRKRTWPPRHGRAAVPGSGGGAAPGADPRAGIVARGADARTGHRRLESDGRARAAAGRRSARHALVAHASGPAQERRALHPEPAAGDLGPGLCHRTRRAVAGAGRVHRRHSDCGDRIQAPGGNRHPAFPRRADGSVLHHRRHEARRVRRRGRIAAGDCADAAAGGLQIRLGHRTGQAIRRADRRGAAHGSLPRASG